MDIERFIYEYRQDRTRKPLSPRTKQLYREYLERLDQHLREHGISFPNLTVEEFEHFLDIQPWGSSARYNALAAIKAYFVWEGRGKDDPLRAHSLPRDPTGPLPTPKAQQIEKLLKSIDQRTVKGKRDFAIFVLTLETGLRANEIATFKRANIDLDNLEFKIRVKGGREWVTPFPASAGDVLTRWFPARDRIAVAGVEECFLALGGRRKFDDGYGPALGFPLTRHGVKQLFYERTSSAGIGRFSPHAFRRAFAVEAAARNTNLLLIKNQGRWRSVRMVEHYTQTLHMDAFRGHFGDYGEV